jgi:cytidylate kinase
MKIITLDGPCGSGKSTLAQMLAIHLKYFYMNSGYLYRSLAYVLVYHFHYDEELLKNPKIEDIIFILDENHFIYQFLDGVVSVFYQHQDITSFIKFAQVSHDASLISAHEAVRKEVIKIQRKFGSIYNLVTDGRDGGTEIYPQAQYKFYITASLPVRAQRLVDDLGKQKKQIGLQEAIMMIELRDDRDMNRIVSPLKKAEDAIEVDTSDKTIQETLDYLLQIVGTEQ